MKDNRAPAEIQGAEAAGTPAAVRVLITPTDQEIVGWLQVLLEPGQAFECRAPKAKRPGGDRLENLNHFFTTDQLSEAAHWALRAAARAPGVYFTLNPVDASLVGMGRATKDANVLRRRWMLIDCDPRRPADVSATDDEKALAGVKAREIRSYLSEQGWPVPVFGDSGNGCHLLYRIDLPANDEGLIKRCLEALATRFNTEAVSVDTSVHNASRICKLYGTPARKGENTPNRPHRDSRLVDIPAELRVVPRELLDGLGPLPVKARHPAVRMGGKTLRVESWVDIEAIEGKYNAATAWEDVLSGWTKMHVRGAETYWCRPGKNPKDGHSAVTNHDGTDRLFVFSDETPFETDRYYSRFGVFALLNHRGDRVAAARALSAEGFGRAVGASKRPEDTPRDALYALDSSAPLEPSFWEGASAAELGIITLSSVQPKEVRYLWPPRFPKGKISLLAGKTGIGKSFVTLDIASRVSCGLPWPDTPDVAAGIGHVIIMAAEDDIADTIIPRLKKMGADLSKIHSVGIATGRDKIRRPPSLADIGRLEATLKCVKNVRLLIVDPIPSFLGRNVDDNKNAELRMILDPLKEFASEHELAILAITHFGKSPKQAAADRVIGSVAYNAVARAVWFVLPDNDDEDRLLMLPAKLNLTADKSGMAFALIDGRVVWEPEPIHERIEDVLNAKAASLSSTKKRGEAADWLVEFMKVDRTSEEVLAAGEAKGYRRNMLFSIKKQLGIRAQKDGFGGNGVWKWKAYVKPETATNGAKGWAD